jgi:hypothetical protein
MVLMDHREMKIRVETTWNSFKEPTAAFFVSRKTLPFEGGSQNRRNTSI